MKRSESSGEQTGSSALMASVRLDLVIAVCALLISTLATAASWWQTRATYQQTQIIQEQLSAQVWPYVGFSEGLPTQDSVEFKMENDGLGPAVVRSVAAFVDGKERGSFVAVLHAVLGPGIKRRVPHGEKIGLNENTSSPGFVIRPGDSQQMFAFRSRTFAKPFITAYDRITLATCYCAIVPGKCWTSDTCAKGDPVPVERCTEDPRDLLHASPIKDLFGGL